MHEGDFLPVEKLFMVACLELGINRENFNNSRLPEIINKVGDLTCVLRWPQIAAEFHSAELISYKMFREILEPRTYQTLEECAKLQCPYMIDFIDGREESIPMAGASLN